MESSAPEQEQQRRFPRLSKESRSLLVKDNPGYLELDAQNSADNDHTMRENFQKAGFELTALEEQLIALQEIEGDYRLYFGPSKVDVEEFEEDGDNWGSAAWLRKQIDTRLEQLDEMMARDPKLLSNDKYAFVQNLIKNNDCSVSRDQFSDGLMLDYGELDTLQIDDKPYNYNGDGGHPPDIDEIKEWLSHMNELDAKFKQEGAELLKEIDEKLRKERREEAATSKRMLGSGTILIRGMSNAEYQKYKSGEEVIAYSDFVHFMPEVVNGNTTGAEFIIENVPSFFERMVRFRVKQPILASVRKDVYYTDGEVDEEFLLPGYSKQNLEEV
jgi:hypothetical protein